MTSPPIQNGRRRWAWRVLRPVLISLVVLLAASKGVLHLARSRTFQTFGHLVPRVQTTRPLVALTFDDGPAAPPFEEVLSLLASRRVRATFFVNGSALAEAPELGRRLVTAGHELGNHTYSHARMVGRSQAFIRSEIERTDALIRSSGAEGPIYFRPPFCWKLFGLPWYLSRTGRTTVTWDLEPDSPPFGDDPASIVSVVRKGVRPGSIILLHVWFPGREPSRAALSTLIDRLREDGYEFATVRELLASR